jgi:hypothetical protein
MNSSITGKMMIGKFWDKKGPSSDGRPLQRAVELILVCKLSRIEKKMIQQQPYDRLLQ